MLPSDFLYSLLFSFVLLVPLEVKKIETDLLIDVTGKFSGELMERNYFVLTEDIYLVLTGLTQCVWLLELKAA